jgi:hypothetical protein
MLVGEFTSLDEPTEDVDVVVGAELAAEDPDKSDPIGELCPSTERGS